MNETRFTRSRIAALIGLLLQIASFSVVYFLALASGSPATYAVAWYLLGGVPVWFASLLLLRQKELAAQEDQDLIELRREKGAGGAMFDEEGGAGLGFKVAAQRLAWMERWLIPAFSLLIGAYLSLMGLQLFRGLTLTRPAYSDQGFQNIPITIVILAVVMLLLFLMSRYASGMGRVREWQILRGCGSYMLGNAIAVAALVACLTIYLYADLRSGERILAGAIPVLMLVLAAETLLNFILDIYRPRSPGVEPRAAFDSRLLGLIGEPGGIAHSIAEAINYQFGFEVSQSWFYQLLQRSIVPLMGAGVITLWVLTTMVIVNPGEHAIVERFGRQLNPEAPLGPGFHWKAPWPIDKSYRFATGRLHEIIVGFRDFDASPRHADLDAHKSEVVLWTQEQHLGQPHFDFVIFPKSEPGDVQTTQPASAAMSFAEESQAAPVNLIRMDVAIQYKVLPEKLAEYARNVIEPEVALRNAAWSAVVRFVASRDIDMLLGEDHQHFSASLKNAIARAVSELRLGIEIVYVGLYNIHPEKTVAEAYRGVINAEHERIGAIRDSLVYESQRLSSVAGDKDRAKAFVLAMTRMQESTLAQSQAQRSLRTVAPETAAALRRVIEPLAVHARARVEADARLRFAEQRLMELQREFEAGIGGNIARQRQAEAQAQAARDALKAAEETMQTAIAPFRREAAAAGRGDVLDAVVAENLAAAARAFWSDQLALTIERLEGEAAAVLAEGSATRWEIEMRTEGQFKALLNERDAYRAAPGVYRTRAYLSVLTDGLQRARKFFLAFDPEDRDVMVRFQAEQEATTDVMDIQAPRRP